MANKYSPYPGDIIPARLEPGEFVLNRNAVKAIGKDRLKEVNDEHYPRFAQKGGHMDNNEDNWSVAKEQAMYKANARKLDRRLAMQKATQMGIGISAPEFRKPTTHIDLHAIKEIPMNPEFNVDDWNSMMGPMSQNLRDYQTAYDEHQRHQIETNKNIFQNVPLTQGEIDRGNRASQIMRDAEQKDNMLQHQMKLKSENGRRNDAQARLQSQQGSKEIANAMREHAYLTEMQDPGTGPTSGGWGEQLREWTPPTKGPWSAEDQLQNQLRNDNFISKKDISNPAIQKVIRDNPRLGQYIAERRDNQTQKYGSEGATRRADLAILKDENDAKIQKRQDQLRLAQDEKQHQSMVMDYMPGGKKGGPKAPINPHTGKRYMTVAEGEKWDAASKKQLSGVRDKAMKDARDKQYAKDKRDSALYELKRGMHQAKMDTKIDGPTELRRSKMDPIEKVKEPKVRQKKSSWLGDIRLALSASKHDSHKGARLRKDAPLAKKEEILKKAGKVAEKEFTGPKDWEATEKEILDYKEPKVASKKTPMTEAEINDYWDKNIGADADWGEDRTVPDPKKVLKPGQYPPERIKEHAQGRDAYNKAWEEQYNDFKRVKGKHPGTGPLISSALKKAPTYKAPSKTKPGQYPAERLAKHKEGRDIYNEAWEENNLMYDNAPSDDGRKLWTPKMQEGGLIRQYAIGDYVEEGKRVFDAGVDMTGAGISAVGKGASAVSGRYGGDDYKDARADNMGKLYSGAYATGEGLQQAGADTLTAGAAGLGAISKLASGTKNLAMAGYGGAKGWLDAGGWNQNAVKDSADILDDEGNVVTKGKSARDRVWSGEARGSLKQRMGKGAGLLGGLLQDASTAQGFEGAPEGYYDKFGFSKGANKKRSRKASLVNIAVEKPKVSSTSSQSELEDYDVTDSTNEMMTDDSIFGDAENYELPSGATTVHPEQDTNVFIGPMPENTGDSNQDEINKTLNLKREIGTAERTSQGQTMYNQQGGFISMDGFIRQSWRNL